MVKSCFVAFVRIQPVNLMISFLTLVSHRAIAPRLTIYVSFDGSSYHAIYLHTTTAKELAQKIIKLPGFIDCLANSSPNVDNNVFSGWSKYSLNSRIRSFPSQSRNLFTVINGITLSSHTLFLLSFSISE